jgi:methylmalonyl-CoA mutase N-terminal domain/subunit
MSVQVSQIEKIKAVKARRDSAAVQTVLAELRTAAQGSANLMHPILAAVKSYATLQEICDVMRDVFGEYRPSEEF